MFRSLGALCCASAILVSTAHAQTAPAVQPIQPLGGPALAPIYAPVPTGAVLRTGTEVALKMREEVTTKNKQARVGQRFNLEVASPVIVAGQTVIPAGTPAIGEITDVRNKGMWGKSGHLGARVLYLTVNGRQIRMTGSFDDKGVTGTAGVVAAIAIVPIAGFFTTGTSAVLPLGGAVKGFVDEDVQLAIAEAAPAPLVVAATSATAPTPTPAVVPPVPSASVAPGGGTAGFTPVAVQNPK
jgi:hypothetical protein